MVSSSWPAIAETQPDGTAHRAQNGLIITKNSYVAAGFFFALGFAVFGCATGSGPRSTDVRRPDVNV